jgi:DNA-binding Lrp family transcriptional regulator
MNAEQTDPLERRVLDALRDDGPQSSVMLVRALQVDRLPLYAALHQMERRGLVRVIGVTTTVMRGTPQDQGPISLWGLPASAATA